MFCLFSISFVCWSETFLRLYCLLRNGLLSSFSLFQSNGKAIVKFSAGILSCLDTQVVLSVSFYDCYPFCSCIMIFGERRRSLRLSVFLSFSLFLVQSSEKSLIRTQFRPEIAGIRANASECRVEYPSLDCLLLKSLAERTFTFSVLSFFSCNEYRVSKTLENDIRKRDMKEKEMKIGFPFWLKVSSGRSSELFPCLTPDDALRTQIMCSQFFFFLTALHESFVK